MGFSPPDSSVHGFFQARILEWVAISFSNYNPLKSFPEKKKKSFPGLSHSQYKLALFCWNYSLTWTYTVNTIPSTPFYPPPTKENRPRIYQCRRSLVFLWLTYWRFLLCWESGRLSGGPYIDSSAPLGCRTAWCVCHHSPGEEAPIKSLATAPQPEPPRVSVKGVASWLLSGFLFFPPNIY